MVHHVVAQLTFGFEIPTFRANRTFEVSHVAVGRFVLGQVRLLREPPAANPASVRSFSRVRPAARRQFRFSVENLPADFALERFRFVVNVGVEVESSPGRVTFVANLTAELLFCLRIEVVS